MNRRTRLLVFGFEPFGADPSNPSADIAKSVGGLTLGGGRCRVQSVVLPVDTEAMPEIIRSAIAKDADNLAGVLLLGLLAGHFAVLVERIAVNILDFPAPDNRGKVRAGTPAIVGGPAAYHTTLPVRRIIFAVAEAGVPIRVSDSAGTYICNQAMYVCRHELVRRGLEHLPAGLVHLPATTAMVARRVAQADRAAPLTSLAGRVTPSLSEADELTAVRTILELTEAPQHKAAT